MANIKEKRRPLLSHSRKERERTYRSSLGPERRKRKGGTVPYALFQSKKRRKKKKKKEKKFEKKKRRPL